ncbi:MAG: MotA/TolQ/ExbB proton channel family protein [Fuerstiella sp.]|nr:MotA/TolQ/ExbB proton channel family protein [Fuerstiella sp.]
MQYSGRQISKQKTTSARWLTFAALAAVGIVLLDAPLVVAFQPDAPGNVVVQQPAGNGLSLNDMLRAGGAVGYLIVLLSLVMVALIADHVMNIRHSTLIPPGLAEEVHRCLAEGKIDEARKLCEQHPGFLSRVLHAGLDETGGNYSAIEKAMEDAAVEQSARLFRRIEYLSVIATIAPMLGLMGTVWGMIQAFLEFEQKANPQVSELAPGIYRALITTLLGLGVAVPSLSAFAVFRNRIDELAAEATLLSEHVFADFRRALQARRSNRERP